MNSNKSFHGMILSLSLILLFSFNSFGALAKKPSHNKIPKNHVIIDNSKKVKNTTTAATATTTSAVTLTHSFNTTALPHNVTCQDLLKGFSLNVTRPSDMNDALEAAAVRDECEILRTDCQSLYTLFNYLYFLRCSRVPVVVAVAILFLWMFFLIFLLASTADTYFVPSMQEVSKDLKLSPALSGLTLMAFGNGAPDVFTAIAALNSQ
eukprot:Awhi_evm1s12602